MHEHVLLNPGGAPAEHAFLKMRPDGNCPLLDSRGLCSLQLRHGEAPLPDTCVTFPRVVRTRGEQVELSGTLACPEVTRLCLLAEDAVEIVPLEVSSLARPPPLSVPLEDPHAEALRAASLRLLHRREYPLASRIVLLGQLASALEAANSTNETAWSAVLEHFDTPEVLEGLHQEFSSLTLPGGACVGLFHSVLEARGAAGRGSRFGTLVRGVFDSLSLHSASPEALDAAWRTLSERWRQLELHHGARLHQYFHNYTLHSLWRASSRDAPGLLSTVFLLALRMGLLRLTLMGHPQVTALLNEPPSAQSQARLDQAAVETFQLLAKHVEQSPEFLSLCEGLLGRGAETLGKVLVFAAF